MSKSTSSSSNSRLKAGFLGRWVMGGWARRSSSSVKAGRHAGVGVMGECGGMECKSTSSGSSSRVKDWCHGWWVSRGWERMNCRSRKRQRCSITGVRVSHAVWVKGVLDRSKRQRGRGVEWGG